MYSCGLRREEVVTLDLADYDNESGRLVVCGKVTTMARYDRRSEDAKRKAAVLLRVPYAERV